VKGMIWKILHLPYVPESLLVMSTYILASNIASIFVFQKREMIS